MRKLFLIPFIIFSAFIFSNKTLTAQVAIQDSLALVDLYDSTDGSNWTTKTNWLTGNVSTWYGITVSSNRVTTISMSNNNITGIIPASFGDLTALQYLYLNTNKITAIPEEISGITTLVEIRAQSNLFSQFPYFVGNMTQLNALWISGNSFGIDFPDTLYNLVNMQSFNISNCNISGTLDSRIANWAKLTHMYFQNNELSGSIPDEIGSFPNLTFLQLYSNNLEGEIPESIGKLGKLEYLRLYDNKLSGIIPDTIYSMTALKEINLRDNYLSGVVSPSIANLTNLTKLYLYNDSLSGEFPSINSLSNLTDIRINNNMFTDFPDISSLTTVQYLYMEDNSFTFEDIEPNIGIASTKFTYSPQDSVGNTQSQTLNEGDTAIMISTVGGSANQYQWYKDGVIISGATNDTLLLKGVTSSDNGQYTCKITNTIASSLTLNRRIINLFVNSLTLLSELSNTQKNTMIYPNPSLDGKFTIESTNYKDGFIYLFEISGKEILRSPLLNNKMELNLSALAKGTYLLRLELKDGNEVIKLIR